MKKVRLYESFHNVDEARHSEIHKAAKKGSYPITIVITNKGGSFDGKVAHQETVDTPAAFPAAMKVLYKKYATWAHTFAIEDATGKILFQEGLEVNESLQYGSYYFSKSNVDSAMQPAKGETKYAVICHNTVEMGKNIMYLKGASSNIGQNFEGHVMSAFNTEEEAVKAYEVALKTGKGMTPSCVSFAYGTLTVKGSNLPFEEIDGKRKQIK